MRVLSSMYRSLGEVGPIGGLRIQLEAAECDAAVGNCVISPGVWR